MSEPRVWTLQPCPSTEGVTALWDPDGYRWDFVAAFWQYADEGRPFPTRVTWSTTRVTWSTLLVEFGPLTDRAPVKGGTGG